MRVSAIYSLVMLTPGLRPAQIAERLGWARSEVMRLLPSLERYRLLLYEEGGRLFVFDPHII